MILICFSERITSSDEFILKAADAYCDLFGEKFDFSVVRRDDKPYLTSAKRRAELYVSLSHSGRYIACAISENHVGLDIQEKKEVDFPVLSKRLFGREITEKDAFYDLFTAGEARKKYTDKDFFECMKSDEPPVKHIEFLLCYAIAVCGEGSILLRELK